MSYSSLDICFPTLKFHCSYTWSAKPRSLDRGFKVIFPIGFHFINSKRSEYIVPAPTTLFLHWSNSRNNCQRKTRSTLVRPQLDETSSTTSKIRYTEKKPTHQIVPTIPPPPGKYFSLFLPQIQTSSAMFVNFVQH